MKNFIISAIILTFVSCNDNYTRNGHSIPYALIENKLDSLISNNESILYSLTHSYDFTDCKTAGGVGPDTLRPHIQDTIIILKNALTNILVTDLIYNGKSIIMDSSSICNLSHYYDDKRQVMRYFVDIKVASDDKNTVCFKVIGRQWVPQFLHPQKYCIEAFDEEMIGKFSISKTYCD